MGTSFAAWKKSDLNQKAEGKSGKQEYQFNDTRTSGKSL
jgi:hypothetical protein